MFIVESSELTRQRLETMSRESTSKYSQVLANRDFKRIWLVGIVSAVGDQVFPICATVILLNQGSGAKEISVLMSLRVIAFLGLAPFGGVWADRLSRRTVIIVGAATRSLLCFLVFLSGENQPLWLLCLLVFLMGVTEAFSGPASGAIIPSIVAPDFLQSANALRAISARVASISGPGIAAALIAAIGPRLGFLFTTICFLITTLLLKGIQIPAISIERKKFFKDLKLGFAFIRQTSWMYFAMCTLALQISILFGTEMVLLPVITADVFDSTRVYPMAIAALSLGSLLSALHFGRINSLSPGRTSFLTWTFLSALLIALIYPINIPFVLICYFIGGIATQPMGIYWATALQKSVPEEMRGRVMSLDATLTGALVPLGMLIAGPLSELLGAKTYLWIALALFLFLNALALSSRGISSFGSKR